MKIMILSRHFPPVPSGGARRPFLMAEAAHDAGHEVFVASPSEPSDFAGICLPHVQPEPPKNVRPEGLRLRDWDLRQWGRELLRWPDPDAAWAKRLGQAAKTAGFTPDLILVSCPPESLLLTGVALKAHYACALWADFRDPWLNPPRRMERKLWFRKFFEGLQGRELLGACDHISAVDQVVADDISAIAGQDRAVEIMRQLVPKPLPYQPLLPKDDIHLVYTGQFSIGDAKRSITTVLNVFAAALRANPRLRLHIAGHMTAFEDEAIRDAPFADRITYHGALGFEAVRQLQSGADGFLLLSSDEGWAVPGKLFEYRAYNAPIVALGTGPWRQSANIIEQDAVAQMAAMGKRNPDSLTDYDNLGKNQFLQRLDSMERP